MKIQAFITSIYYTEMSPVATLDDSQEMHYTQVGSKRGTFYSTPENESCLNAMHCSSSAPHLLHYWIISEKLTLTRGGAKVHLLKLGVGAMHPSNVLQATLNSWVLSGMGSASDEVAERLSLLGASRHSSSRGSF